MKPLHVLLVSSMFAFLGHNPLSAQYIDLAPSYALGLPFGKMGKNVDPLHCLHFEVGYGFRDSRLSLGLAVQTGRYDRFREDLDVDFGDGPFTAPVIVNHRLSTLMLTARYNLVEAGPIIPYLSARLGGAFFSSALQVRDPGQHAGAEGSINLYEETLHRSNLLSGGIGGGARVDLYPLFRRIGRERLYLDAEMYYNVGPSSRMAFSLRHDGVRAGQSAQPGDAPLPYELKQTDLHDLEIYETPLHLIQFRIGAIFRIGVG